MKTAKLSPLARNLRSMFKRGGLRTYRDAEKATGVSRDTLRNLLTGRTDDLVDANLEKVCEWCVRALNEPTSLNAIRGRD